ncbi:LacI family DNA-binding transcriptional regulator [Microlunatus speluncae]|uniref:LacI family DNA-binding transcriptional regulator n=1 Tax=Microlunatus speluncae TaxID=2594267 RepID=UPI001375CCF8|nr:LacI family DNA-binding transcriptional regulator [Microlunatus speluncae]
MSAIDRPAIDRDPDRIKPARIKDVAARAGVSLKTVTNVVHQRSNVRDSTRARVLAAIEELDYRPSLAGRQLQSGRSTMITLALPRIDEPYLGALAHAMIAAASPRGYTVVMDETGGVPEREEQAAAGYPGHGIDGVIFSPFALDPEAMAAMSRRTPMVLLAAPLPDSHADYVAIDNPRSAGEVVDHLYATGRRRFGFIGRNPHQPNGVGEIRLAGVRDRLAGHGLALAERQSIPTGRYTREAGERAIAEADELHGCDAIVCCSDLLAIGAIRGLKRAGLRVPEDIAVVGWDNIVDTEYVTPTLTSVAPDLEALAEQTIEALLDRIDGNREPARTFVVPHTLMTRESTGSGTR